MGRKREIQQREKYYFWDTIFYEIKEISKEEFYKDVVENINSYEITKEGNNYYFAPIKDEECYYDDNEYNEDIMYSCTNINQNIIKEWLKGKNKS